MCKIGIIGGLSPESTVTYYQYITRKYHERFGDHAYPPIIIYSVNFQKFEDWMSGGQWSEIIEEISRITEKLSDAGADFGLIATNTMHFVFEEVEKRSPHLSSALSMQRRKL